MTTQDGDRPNAAPAGKLPSAFTGYTQPRTYEGPVDNSSTGKGPGVPKETSHFQWPATAPTKAEAPKAAKADPPKPDEPAPKRRQGGKN